MFALQSITRLLLAVLATVGMLVPNAVMPCCGCCAADAKQSDNSSPCCGTTSCCEASSCCDAKLHIDSRACCTDQSDGAKSDCGRPDCRCSVSPARAPPLPLSPSVENPTSSKAFFAVTPTLDTARFLLTQRLTAGSTTPHLVGNLRLHSLLCVWLN